MTITLFVGIWLTAFRVTRIFTKDSLFDRQRNAFFKRFPPNPETARLVNAAKVSKWGQLIACPYCIGFWVSGAIVFAVASWQSMEMPLLWWFATSGAVGLTAKNLDG